MEDKNKVLGFPVWTAVSPSSHNGGGKFVEERISSFLRYSFWYSTTSSARDHQCKCFFCVTVIENRGGAAT